MANNMEPFLSNNYVEDSSSINNMGHYSRFWNSVAVFVLGK